jgi:hypothetical protein
LRLASYLYCANILGKTARLKLTTSILFKKSNMERVKTLVNGLQQKLDNGATINELLQTVKILESELQHLKKITPTETAVFAEPAVKIALEPSLEQIMAAEEKVVEVLEVDEEEIEMELEEIKRNASVINGIASANRPAIKIEDVPTLQGRLGNLEAYVPFEDEAIKKKEAELAKATEPAPIKVTWDETAKEINEAIKIDEDKTVNETVVIEVKKEISEALQEQPIKDLKKAIGINEKFLYINELFRGDEDMYERSIKTINGFDIFAEAEFWIRRELKTKLGWDDRYQTVRQFDDLIKRRFL